MSVNMLIDKKINDYLIKLNSKEKKAVLGVVKTFADKHVNDEVWDDKTYLAEMNKRFKDYESGKVKTYSLDEVENRARAAYKAKRNKK